MAAPATPDNLDGKPMDQVVHNRLRRVIAAIYAEDPLRSKDHILAQAIDAVRQTATLRGGRWVGRAAYRMDGGRGPVVILKAT